MTDQQEQRTSKFKDVLNALVEMQHSPAYAVRREVLSRAELLIADLERSNIALSSALADAERRGFRTALNKVAQDFAENVYEIGGEIGTNEVLAFLESRVAHYPEAQATQEEVKD